MYYLKIQGKEIGPYVGIKHANGKIEGNILPIIYDNAIIELTEGEQEFALCYKVSKNLFGAEITYADVVNIQTGETFSFQVNNIFFLSIVEGDPKLIVKLGNELKLYENFSKTTKNIEPDGDKTELTPLGYYDMYVSYDDNYYYPEVFNIQTNKEKEIDKFYDYFGFKSYIDENGGKHLVMFIETIDSTENAPKWYFFDNFKKVSECIRFSNFIGDDSEEYVEDWHIDGDGVIQFSATTSGEYYIDVSTGEMMRGKYQSFNAQKSFIFTRAFEDTNISTIVGKNENGFFLVGRGMEKITEKQQKALVYFEKFIKYVQLTEGNLFFFVAKKTNDVVVVNEEGNEWYTTDLSGEEEIIQSVSIGADDILTVILNNNEKRMYFRN